MKLICKCEERMQKGDKHMQFTKDKPYEASKTDEYSYIIADDDGKDEEFWNLDIMFIKAE